MLLSDYDLFPSDICMSIKDLLSSPIIRVMQNHQQVDVLPFYTFPDIDESRSVPRLIFYQGDLLPDFSRAQIGEKIKDNEVYDNYGNLLRVDLRDYPEPFSVDIYIRLKFKFYEHRDAISKEIYKRFKLPRGRLLVGGVELPCALVKEIPLLDGVDEYGNKVSQWLFSVSTYFDVNNRNTVSTVKDLNIDF